jgi:hypothetical protein
LRSLARQFGLAGLFYLFIKLAPAARPLSFLNVWPWRVGGGTGSADCVAQLRQLAWFAALFSRQGPPAIGSNCAVFAPDSAVFAPRTGVSATGAWAMFLTNNHVENTFGLR